MRRSVAPVLLLLLGVLLNFAFALLINNIRLFTLYCLHSVPSAE
jgi:hypothetical protein